MLRKGSGELPLPLPLGMIHAVISVLSGIKTMSGEIFGHNLISEAPSASKSNQVTFCDLSGFSLLSRGMFYRFPQNGG